MFKMQVEITAEVPLLVPGKHLMYSTCSSTCAENEAVVAKCSPLPYLNCSTELEGISYQGRPLARP